MKNISSLLLISIIITQTLKSLAPDFNQMVQVSPEQMQQYPWAQNYGSFSNLIQNSPGWQRFRSGRENILHQTARHEIDPGFEESKFNKIGWFQRLGGGINDAIFGRMSLGISGKAKPRPSDYKTSFAEYAVYNPYTNPNLGHRYLTSRPAIGPEHKLQYAGNYPIPVTMH